MVFLKNIKENIRNRKNSVSLYYYPTLCLIVFLALFLFLTGCSKYRDREVASSVKEDAPMFDVYRVHYRAVKRNIEGLGNLEVFVKATLVSKIDGIVEKIWVKKGDTVHKETPLFFISNYQLVLEQSRAEKEVLGAEEELETVQLQYREDEKNLFKKFLQLEKMGLQMDDLKKEIAFIKDTVRKKKLLLAKGGITEEAYQNLLFSLEVKRRSLGIMKKEYELQEYGFRDLDLIKEGYTIPENKEEKQRLLVYINTKLQRKRIQFAEIRIKKAQLEKKRIVWLMEKRTIRSPVDGVVTEIKKFIGEKVNVNDTITTVIDLSQLIARISFSERDFPLFKKGAPVSIFVDSLQKNLPGTVYTIDPYIDEATRNMWVDCRITNSGSLVPGMFVKVTMPITKKEQRLLIPKEACIVEKEGEGVVFIVSKSNRIFKRSINWEPYDNVYILVNNGLKDDDLILMKPLINLMDGMKIRYRETA